jgi:hypothetical protein
VTFRAIAVVSVWVIAMHPSETTLSYARNACCGGPYA